MKNARSRAGDDNQQEDEQLDDHSDGDQQQDGDAQSGDGIDGDEMNPQDLPDNDSPGTEMPGDMQLPDAPPPPNISVLDLPEAFGYQAFTSKHDEVINAHELCEPIELERLRGVSRQAAGQCLQRHRPPCQPAATALDGPAKPSLGV